MSFSEKRRRIHFLDKLRSLTGCSSAATGTDKQPAAIPKSMNPPLITSTPPSPTTARPTPPPPPPPSSTSTSTATLPVNDLSGPPRKHRSRSFGDAYVIYRRQSSPLVIATSDLSSASPTIQEIRNEDSSNESARHSGRDSVSPETEKPNSQHGFRLVRKRASSGGDLISKGVASLPLPLSRGGKVFNAKLKSSEKLDKSTIRGLSRDDLSVAKGRSDQSGKNGSGNGTSKQARRSVHLLEPQLKAMKLRRSNSDRVTHDDDAGVKLKDAEQTRRIIVSAQPRSNYDVPDQTVMCQIKL
ncbi:hypothetical protein ACOMHN_061520 [Nucella lapillus]